MNYHNIIEKNLTLLIILIVFAISFGGLVEIIPLFFQKEITEPVKGLTPYTPLQLEGRDVYISHGCVGCHSQMIRPLRAEVERYGHYSVAGESVFDHPFLWGSKRTGPDLARIGGRYSDDWHRIHLTNPRYVVPESIMPAYSWLQNIPIDAKLTAKKMRALQKLGVPYTDQDIENAENAVKGHTQMDALVHYLQSLGTAIKEKR